MNVAKPGFDRLAGWSFSQSSRVTRYTNFVPRFATNVPLKKSRTESCAISALVNDEFALKTKKRIWTG
jgi:hypothetical protein